jgi:hypothetical protein
MPGKPLDPSVHLIVGLLMFSVSGYTLMFVETTNSTAMKLFMYIGLGFIVIAIFKYVMRYMKSGSLKKTEEQVATNLSGIKDVEADYKKQLARQQHLQARNNPSQQQNPRHQRQPQIINCPLCQTKNYSTSNYCHICGYKLR